MTDAGCILFRSQGVFTLLATVSAILAIVSPTTLFVLWWTFWKQRKALTYEPIEFRILGAPDDLSLISDLKMTLGDKPVENASIVNVMVRNSGSVPIRSADFERPLHIVFAPESEILAADVSSKTDALLGVQHVLDKYGEDGGNIILTIAPLLLNPGDSFTISALVSNHRRGPILVGRIAGVNKIERVRQKLPPEVSSMWQEGKAWMWGSVTGTTSSVAMAGFVEHFHISLRTLAWFGTVVSIMIVVALAQLFNIRRKIARL